MKQDEIVQDLGKPIFRPLGIIQGLFLLCFISSPFIWIWVSWALAWRVAVTGILGALLIKVIYSFVKRVIAQTIEEELN